MIENFKAQFPTEQQRRWKRKDSGPVYIKEQFLTCLRSTVSDRTAKKMEEKGLGASVHKGAVSDLPEKYISGKNISGDGKRKDKPTSI
ncbi:hypothetical protein NDU88_005650 [Pleurodeles waltl]|uniref:Uncharacterized protein n=1 Tax=Pleurodeles waltl TaxID=8319 RepID=A0AAV7MWY7_PLEWA|nr:hypothetical protein NDU88_005650 [Pleurodeles waltl]